MRPCLNNIYAFNERFSWDNLNLCLRFIFIFLFISFITKHKKQFNGCLVEKFQFLLLLFSFLIFVSRITMYTHFRF